MVALDGGKGQVKKIGSKATLPDMLMVSMNKIHVSSHFLLFCLYLPICLSILIFR